MEADSIVADKGEVAEGRSSSFLASFSSPVAPPFLATPAPPADAPPVPPPAAPSAATRSSGRLAAKPTSTLSTMEKVIHVLLKKSGLKEDPAPAPTADRLLYEGIYGKPLPPPFLEAVSSLLDTAGASKKKKVTAPAVAAAAVV